MADSFHLYKGLEVYPLVYPHVATRPGFAHDYGQGFDAAVRIREPHSDSAKARSRVFRLPGERPFMSTGEARRASTAYAELLIDANESGNLWDAQ